MLQTLSDILEITVITVGIFLIQRYVFLEPGMEPKKQRLFYACTIAAILAAYLLASKDAATLAALLAGGLNISLARKSHRLPGLFLSIPLPGIINGIMVPILIMPPILFSFPANWKWIYTFIIYAITICLLLLFYIKGKAWRNWFQKNMGHRHLHRWESFLLCTVGILMLMYSTTATQHFMFNMERETRRLTDFSPNQYTFYMCVSGVTAFVMTIIIIVLIMQGNKRSYYHEQVAGMQFNIITMMADIVENRDENTGGHIKRTAKYVEIIARELKRREAYPEILTEEHLADMIVAAPLHDIGKIHISDTILNKPGRLTEEEFETMKSHTTSGQNLLNHARRELGEYEYLNIAVEMAAYHHEWWNGKGYPDGIKGEEIPLCARIMAVADVFDALSSRRCYKDAMPLEKAYAIIREETGTHFDPKVAEAFFAVTGEIEAAMEDALS